MVLVKSNEIFFVCNNRENKKFSGPKCMSLFPQHPHENSQVQGSTCCTLRAEGLETERSRMLTSQ